MTLHREGEFFGGFQLLEEVGQGGAARVFRSRHVHPRYADTPFALKLPVIDPNDALDMATRFRRESYLLSTLRHPNIVRTYEAGVEGSQPYLAMEYVHGRDLHGLMERWGRRPLPLPIALYIGGCLLEALHYAHTLKDSSGRPLQIVHLDVKPANVLVSYDGQVKLMDFGVASIFDYIHKAGEPLLGTKGYFAPEVLAGGSVDHRADIFAVGVILYEMLCGTFLFDGDRTSRVFYDNKRAKIPKPRKINPFLPIEIERVILKALHRKPQRRFPHCAAMQETLVPFLLPAAHMHATMASFIRDLFGEPDQRDRDKTSVSRDVVGPSRVRLGVASSDPQVFYGLSDEMHRVGVMVESISSVQQLQHVLDVSVQPTAMLFDITSYGMISNDCWNTMTEYPEVPLIILTDNIDSRTMHHIESTKVVDILLKPLLPDRLVLAIQMALRRRNATPPWSEGGDTRADVAVRVLLVSADIVLVARLSHVLTDNGLLVDAVSTVREALEKSDRASYRAVIYDHSHESGHDATFALRFRQLVGMDVVPIVYLSDLENMDALVLPVRCAVRERRAPSVVISAALNELLAASQLGRAFKRYKTSLRAEMRSGGRTIPAETLVLSRGGVLLGSSRMPAVGSDIGVSIWETDDREPLGLQGAVAYVEMVDGGAHIGVALKPLTLRTEMRLIAVVKRLGASEDGDWGDAQKKIPSSS